MKKFLRKEEKKLAKKEKEFQQMGFEDNAAYLKSMGFDPMLLRMERCVRVLCFIW